MHEFECGRNRLRRSQSPGLSLRIVFYLDWWIPYAVERCARDGHFPIMHIIAFMCTLMASPCSRSARICSSPRYVPDSADDLSLSPWCHPDIVPKLSDGSLNHENFDARCGRVHLTLKRGCRRMHNNYNIYRNVLCTAWRVKERESHSHFIWSKCMQVFASHTYGAT